MPYINLTTSATVSAENAEKIKADFGKAISCFSGKSEAWLMVKISDGNKMWFKGDNSGDIAMVDVSLYGAVNPAQSDKMSSAVCDILKERLNISPDKVYIKYSGYNDWGWNGGNF